MRITVWDEFVNKPLIALGMWGNILYVMCQPSAELSKAGDQRHLAPVRFQVNDLQGGEGKLSAQMIKILK